MILHYKNFTAICKRLIGNLWMGKIIEFPLENRYFIGRSEASLEEKFHNIIDNTVTRGMKV